jgi:hypothetical protein
VCDAPLLCWRLALPPLPAGCRLQPCLDALPNCFQAWVQRVRALRPLNPVVWQSAFAMDPDLECLLYRADVGVHVSPMDRLPRPFRVRNHKSFAEAQAVASPVMLTTPATLQEVADGWLVRAPSACRAQFVHPLGAVPKGESLRVIHDLSSPRGASVNDLQRHWRRSWLCADSIMAMLRPMDWVAKKDVSAYYRHFPVHPAHRPLLACEVDSVLMWDTRLPFGLRTARGC